jgi:thiol-disulfide isomerase/thioredoxin
VRSPGTDFPHRSAPNRGGAILSDTFSIDEFELKSRKSKDPEAPDILRKTPDSEGLDSCILCLMSSISLVDQHLDPGAGEGTHNLQPAPVTVSASQRSIDKKIDRITLDSEIHRSPVTRAELSRSIGHLSAEADPTTPDSLKIGDFLPPGLEVGPVLNQPDLKIRLDNYRGKYLLLVFWSPTCSGSIGALPRIDQLSQKYKKQLEVLPITIFSEERISEVSRIYTSFQTLSLPIATEASYLRALFPHTRIPHVVLIDPEGKIRAITGAEDVTMENLDMLFSTGSGNFRTKVDRKILLHPNEKLISGNTHLENKNIWLQSAFTGYIPDVGGSLIQNYEGFSHIRITNMTPIYMFQLAYSERDLVDYYGVNRIETRGFEKDELTTDKSGADALEWMEEGNHVFGYELIAPPSYDPYQLMREDLRRYFPHIEVTVETQSRKVLALIRQEGRDFPPSAGKPRSYQSSPMGVRMTNYPLQGFVYHLNAAFWRASPTPIINLTGIDYPIDLQLDAPLGNYGRLREELQNNGLDLVEREEEIKILVLKKTAPFKSLTQ